MKFKWNFSEEIYEKYKRNQRNHDLADAYGKFLGCIRTGNLCFDIMNYGNMDCGNCLVFELYVGGVDTGYGYGKDNYPYDLCDVNDIENNEDLSNVKFEDFKKEMEEYLEEHIKALEGYVAFGNINVNLIDKANEPLKEW